MKCQICEQEVTPTEEYRWDKEKWFINAGVNCQIQLKGHKTCMENVNKLVVIPNRRIAAGDSEALGDFVDTLKANIKHLPEWLEKALKKLHDREEIDDEV